MKKIDTDTWKEISIPSVFNMSNTKSIVQRDIVPDSGDIPYVTASSENNGVLTKTVAHRHRHKTVLNSS